MIRDFFNGNIDASRTGGKIKLLLLLSVLSFLFNYVWVFNRPVMALHGAVMSLSVFQDGEQLSSSGFIDRQIKIAEHDREEYYDCEFILDKIRQPFGKIDLKEDTSGHFEKLAFRFIPFWIAHTLHLEHRGLYLLQVLLGFLFPLLIWKLLHEAAGSIKLATAGAVLINGLYAGCAFMVDGIFFDAFAYFFIACGMLRLRRWMSVIFLLCAAFTDERAVPAACLVSVWHLMSAPGLINRNQILREAAWLLVFLGVYALLRFTIGASLGLETGHRGVGWNIFRLNLPNIVVLVWSVFEGGWIIITLAAFGIYDSKCPARRAIAAFAAVSFCAVFLLGMVVGDSVRSHQYAYPLLLIAIIMASRRPGGIPRRWMWLAVFLTLISPITIYLGMDAVNGRISYNMSQAPPGYLGLFGF